jgi:DNA-binding NarL/FixJ family response regulator
VLRTSPPGELLHAAAILRSLYGPRESTAPERWGQEVARAVGAAVSAARVLLVVCRGPSAQIYDAGEIELGRPCTTASEWRATPPAAQPHAGVWCRRASRDVPGAPAASYDRGTVEDVCYDAVGLTVSAGDRGLADAPHATISCHRAGWHAEELRPALALLDAVFPAVDAAFRTHLLETGERAVLVRLVDMLGASAALYSVEGDALHQTAALANMVAADPDSERLREALSAAARRAAESRAGGSAGHARANAPQAGEIRQDVRTMGAQYRVRARLLGSGDGQGWGTVAVALEPRAWQTRPTATLRKQFALTEREVDVTYLLSAGKSNADIARALGISPYTARHHTQNVLSKLGVRSRAAVPQLLMTAGLSDLAAIPRVDLLREEA